MAEGAAIEASASSLEPSAPGKAGKGVASNGATPHLAGTAQRNASGSVDRVMPKDFSIAFEIGNGSTKPGVERGPRKHSMKGFEDTYVDIVDYIIRITHRIWEDQDVGYIYDTYAPGCFVHDAFSAWLS